MYGGGLWFTYLNRDLRLAGRVTVRQGDTFQSRLFDSEEAIGIIPSTSLSLNSDQASLDRYKDFDVLLGLDAGSLKDYVAGKLGVDPGLVVDWDLSLVDAEPPAIVGDFVTSHRIDNQRSTFSGLKAFLETEPMKFMNVLAVFDHEEIGSFTRPGARGNFLKSVLQRIVGTERLPVLMANSLALSCDAAQGIHPNFVAKHDCSNSPQIGRGVALKGSPGAIYATDLTSSAPILALCRKTGLISQVMMNRADIPGGSTFGPDLAVVLGVSTVDIGEPMLAMHSIRETVAISDVCNFTALLREAFAHFDEYQVHL
jgi:aspartyl aminopeptidase